MPDAMQGKRGDRSRVAPRWGAASPAAKVYGPREPGEAAAGPALPPGPPGSHGGERSCALSGHRRGGFGLAAAAGGEEGPSGAERVPSPWGRVGRSQRARVGSPVLRNAPRGRSRGPRGAGLGGESADGTPGPRCAPRDGPLRSRGPSAGLCAGPARAVGVGVGVGGGDRVASPLAAARSEARGRGSCVGSPAPGAPTTTVPLAGRVCAAMRKSPGRLRPRQAPEKLPPRPRAGREQCEEEPPAPLRPPPSRARMCGPCAPSALPAAPGRAGGTGSRVQRGARPRGLTVPGRAGGNRLAERRAGGLEAVAAPRPGVSPTLQGELRESPGPRPQRPTYRGAAGAHV